MATNTPRLPGENNQAEQADRAKDARGLFTDFAIRSGAMTDAQELSEEMFRFAAMVVEHCASIGDAYGNEESGGNAGAHIRAQLRD
ncbi:MAG: hypothetical protein EOP24_39935 [Hyphomicrobiales bacterium]|nr:MAG: hypothetical protein EOP24_39935 [Hyphomicrobiales bacterium]